MEGKKRIGRNLFNIVYTLAAMALAIIFIPKLLRFFMPFIIGFVVALIANPLVRFLEKNVKMRRAHSSVLLIIAVLALVIFGGYALISLLLGQIAGFAGELPDLMHTVSGNVRSFANFFASSFASILRRLPFHIDNPLQSFSERAAETFGEFVAQIGTPTVSAAGHLVKSLPNLLVNFIMVVMSSYFFLADRDHLAKWAKDHMPASWSRYYDWGRASVRKMVGGYFSAVFKIMFVVAGVLFIGFLVIGERYAFLLAILIAFLDFLPVFGTGTVLIPWALYSLFTGNMYKLIGLVIIYIASQAVHQLVQPKMVGDSMGLAPMYTLVLLYLGFKFYGLGGMILAVPVGLVVKELYGYGAFNGFFTSVKELAADINRLRRGE